MDEKEITSSENKPELNTKVGSLQELLERASGLRAAVLEPIYRTRILEGTVPGRTQPILFAAP